MANQRKMIYYNGNDGSLGKDGNAITILTYNVLAPHLSRTNWDDRKSKLLEELVSHKADVMCLQEVVDTDVTKYFGPKLLKHGYKFIMNTERNDMYYGDDNKFKMGCAIFYKISSFRVNEDYKLEINFRRAARQFLREHNLDEHTNAFTYLRDKAGIGCLLEYRHKKKKIMICIMTVHLTADKNLSDVKLLQTYLLLKGLSVIEAENIPIIVAGDFNITPKSEPYMMITNRQMPKPAKHKTATTNKTAIKDETAATDETAPKDETAATDVTAPKDGTAATDETTPKDETAPKDVTAATDAINLCLLLDLPMAASLESAYSTILKPGSHQGLHECKRMDFETMEPIFTTASKTPETFKNTIDYIFYTKEDFTVEGILELIDDVEELPTEVWPSDHIALMAYIQLKKNRKMNDKLATLLKMQLDYIWNKLDKKSILDQEAADQECERSRGQKPVNEKCETSTSKEAADQECETSRDEEPVNEECETCTSKDAADQECETSSDKEPANEECETSTSKAAADQECETSTGEEPANEECETSTSKEAAYQECETSSGKEPVNETGMFIIQEQVS